jgi:hypothetical protein
MYLFDKESISAIAKAVMRAVDQQGSNLKHGHVLDAIAAGLGKENFHDLSETVVSCDAVKSKKLYIDPKITDFIKIKSNKEA